MKDPESRLQNAGFSLVRVLGRGAFADVFLARKSDSGMQERLKILRPESLTDGRAAARIEHEFRMMKCAGPELTLQPYGFDCEAGILRTEYRFGVVLRDLLTYRAWQGIAPALTLEEALLLSGELFRMLSMFSERNLLAGDLKPANLLVTFPVALRCRLLLIDFGEVCVIGQLPLKPGRTDAYSAPECILDGAALTPAATCFSAGVVGYELLAGERPFGLRPEIVERNYRLGIEPLPVTCFRAETPVAVEQQLLSLLSHDPFQRPSAAEGAGVMREVLAGYLVEGAARSLQGTVRAASRYFSAGS